MARPASQALKHYQRALATWPKDELRPQVQFAEFLKRGVEKRLAAGAATPAAEQKELAQVNALYSLAEDRYAKRFPLGPKISKPQSQPTYFKDLLRELEEAPSRTWLQSMSKRLSGIFRWE
ncbi:uncharacterized protein VDAG_09564 [Verticillium dahliae VdLs.17]|uniref:Uncharacterized protein n=1 Tax=Verticillium dahliae (strain VdLs.17 / ATCC MYA-4575 / FGSC 10137) TaxID=498257 RepID=G2XHD2_VERDV|nr:uncharacterized protein VDAG_09564 [Verticillium dahliae VdLs.17]EGY19230.1 hypothetical protein VDAG_09564 [Verticillium dahliae VdLs.17]